MLTTSKPLAAYQRDSARVEKRGPCDHHHRPALGHGDALLGGRLRQHALRSAQ